jgi:hypothetical protein
MDYKLDLWIQPGCSRVGIGEQRAKRDNLGKQSLSLQEPMHVRDVRVLHRCYDPKSSHSTTDS